MDSRPDPSSLMTQEQMFFNSIDTTDNGRSFFPSNAPGMSLTQDDFMRQQDGSMEDCCDPHQYMPPTPSSPLPFSPVFSQGMTNQRQQITSVSSSEGNCPRPFQHSPYHDNQVSSSFSMNQGHLYNRAQLPTVPTSKQFSGEYNFEISFGPPTDSAPKSATWTYSTKTSKLYTNIGSYCPFQFKTNGKPLHRAAYIRAVAMFKGSSNLHDIVKMCPNHAETSSEDPSIRNNFFIRSNNANAVYLECPQTGRHSVIVPYSGPQAGTNYVTEMFSFKCFSSCASGHGRKPIEIIFTLEDTDSGSILGRCVVEIRVCACPGRDRRSDELNQEKSLFPNNGSKRALKQKNINRKKVKKATQEEYTITTSHKDIHDVLMNIKLALEGRFYSKSEIDDDDESGNSSAKRAQPSSQTATTSRETNSDNKPGYSSCM